MVLFSFNISNHIDLIKTGAKHQTTRIPRKLQKHGNSAYKVGDKVQLYYRSRMKNSCQNCINTDCYFYKNISDPYYNSTPCKNFTNFFGESEIIDIIHYHYGDYKERQHEIWTGYPLALAGKEDMGAWARSDGFSDGYIQAHDWFKATTGNPNWANQNLDVIVWQAEPIIKRYANQKTSQF